MFFDKNALNTLDDEIKSVLPASKLIVPDDVRGDFETLEQAILMEGWPNINSTKGKFLFVLDEKENRIQRASRTQGSNDNSDHSPRSCKNHQKGESRAKVGQEGHDRLCSRRRGWRNPRVC